MLAHVAGGEKLEGIVIEVAGTLKQLSVLLMMLHWRGQAEGTN
jgi:hypothetical protein